jgi:chromosome segregation ATPase
MMKKAIFIIVVVAMVVAIPIAFKYSSDANRFRNDLAAQIDTVATVRAELAIARDSLKRTNDEIVSTSQALDSMTQLYDQSMQLANGLSNRISKLSKQTDSLKALSETYLAQLQTQEKTLSAVRGQLADTSQLLSTTRINLDSAKASLNGNVMFINQLHPWYLKWKHDATERNWLEKIFGADKAKAPEFPEPVWPDMKLQTDAVANP